MALQDFRTWTETDPDGELTVTANKIEVDDTNLDGDNRVYKDGGVGHYNIPLTHQFELTVTAWSDVMYQIIWALSDSNAGWANFGDDDLEMVISNPLVEGYRIVLAEHGGMHDDVTDIDLTHDTKYYITVEREEVEELVFKTIVTIRTGSHEGDVVGTLDIEEMGAAFRYLYATGEIV